MKIVLTAFALLFGGCATTPKAKPHGPPVAELQAKAGVSPVEWEQMMQPMAAKKNVSVVPTGVEYLKPGVLVVFISEVTDESSWLAAELRFHRKEGKWELQDGILREEDRKRGRFVSAAEFEQILIKNEEELRRKLAESGKEWVLDFSFEDYVAEVTRTESSKGYWQSRLPSIRGWRYIADQLHYKKEVFVINSSRETVVGLEFDGEYHYLVSGAFDSTNIFTPAGLKKPAPKPTKNNFRSEVRPNGSADDGK